MRPSNLFTMCGAGLVALVLAACTPSAAVPTPTNAPPAPPTLAPTVAAPTVAPTAAPATPAPTAVPTVAPTASPAPGTATGSIVYLAGDGATVTEMQPDGSGATPLFTIPKRPSDTVYDLVVAPEQRFMVYAVEGEATPEGSDPSFSYYMLPNGQTTPVELGPLFGPARLSPDGKRFLLQQRDEAVPGNAVIYEPAKRVEPTQLPFRGQATWFPDGQSLLYIPSRTDVGPTAIVRYDLADGKETTLLELNAEGEDTWYVQEAHAINTPQDGQIVLFYGGQRKNMGASGNGLQWFAMPASGGTPEPLTDPNGNQATAFGSSPGTTWFAYGESAHSNACESLGTFMARAAGLGGGVSVTAPVPGMADGSQPFVTRGLSWGSDALLVFGVRPYTCGSDGRSYGEAAIYLWDVSSGNGTPVEFRQLTAGSFPNWLP